MEEVISITARGLQVGAIYAVVAMGMAMTFNVSKVLNFAHGHMFMIATVAVWWLWEERDVPIGVVLVIALVITSALAAFEERFVVRPSSRLGATGWVVSTLGFGTLLAFGAEKITENQPQPVSFYWTPRTFDLFGAQLDTYRMMIIGVAILVAVILMLGLRRTMLGRSILAVSQNPEAAQLRGINVSRVMTVNFAVAAALAALAGVLMAPYTFAEAHVGFVYVLKGFIAAVVGGLTGKRIIESSLFGGFALGVIEEWGVEFVGLNYRNTVVIALLLVVMLVRPQGVFGVRERSV